MFGRVRLFRLFGFTVYVDASWILIAALVTWSLATNFFPEQYAELSRGTYWIMGAVGAAGLFFSLVFHEFCHSLIARKYGLEMKGITLFLFGGVSEMSESPKDPKTEFFMALAGPLSSLVLGFGCYGLAIGGNDAGWPVSALGVLGYLSFINWVLAGFNLLPAFPLDGGRVLRSALWKWKQDLKWATRIVCNLGSGFGIAMVVLGGMGLFMGRGMGFWYVLIGLFLHKAARVSYRRVEKRVSSQEGGGDSQ